MALAKKITRREMLAGSLGAGAATLLFQARLWSADAPVDRNRFVLLADTHVFGDRGKVLRDTNPYENFERARAEYGALASRPAGVIIAGDCAALTGEAADYEVLRELVDPIPMPVTFSLGNHDHRERFWAAFAGHRARPLPVADRHVTRIEAPQADWFVLDSLDATNSTPGRLGEAQLEWLARELDRRPDKPALVVAHHYPLPDDDPSKLKSALLDTAGLYEVIVPRKQVKAYVFGHSHRWEHGKIDDLHLVNLPALAWLFDAKQPRGWVDARFEPGGMRLTVQCLDPSHEAHGRPLELAWR